MLCAPELHLNQNAPELHLKEHEHLVGVMVLLKVREHCCPHLQGCWRTIHATIATTVEPHHFGTRVSSVK